jgi:hypothetical protein
MYLFLYLLTPPVGEFHDGKGFMSVLSTSESPVPGTVSGIQVMLNNIGACVNVSWNECECQR